MVPCPSRGVGGACAADFAVTIRQWSGEGMKNSRERQHGDSHARCAEQGLSLVPFVIGADGGGLRPVVRRVCVFAASAGEAREGEELRFRR
jgi:hypothetical protein